MVEYAEYMFFLTQSKAKFVLWLYLFIDQLPMNLCYLGPMINVK